MRKPTRILASESVSVVDDVSIDTGGDAAVGLNDEPDDPNAKCADLGGGFVEINGYVFHENWDEIDPPGCDDEPEISHDEVMAKIRALFKARI